MNWQWTSIDSIQVLKDSELSALKPIGNQTNPFLQYAFLQALEASSSVGNKSGWKVNHVLIKDQNELIAFLPAYIKIHSYGEYVFDQSWAQAYQQHNLNYYPKLAMCIPFTPVTGARALVKEGVLSHQIAEYLHAHKEAIMRELGVSSIHCLFPDKDFSEHMAQNSFHQRQSVQFNWHNKNYTDFDDFLNHLTARRRRSIRKERASIGKQHTHVQRIVGNDISQQDMQFFYACYQQTYLKRSGHGGYLSGAFFEKLRANMPQNLMLVLARTNGKPVASALFLHDENGLFGRYWGALSEVSGLHFEACYYQGIEFCIEQNIALFNPGTQGEHKILRGFEPSLCFSNHSMLEPAFDRAVSDFLNREKPHILEYHQQSASLLPFKQV